jgi:hypothetical protein
MPLIFVHGVNTRDGKDYRKNLAARDELLQRLVLAPLTAKGPQFSQIKIVNPYWGDQGVDFKWNMASLPKVRLLEDLGADTLETPKSDLELRATIENLVGTSQDNSSGLESLGTNEDILKRAAEKDLTQFIEAVLSPIILSEMNLAEEAEEIPDTEGVVEALLVVAGQEVANDPKIKNMVAVASTDDEVIELLKEEVQIRFKQLFMNSKLVLSEDTNPVDGGLESLGPDWLEELQDRVGEVFDRAKGAFSRVATIPALNLFREGLHRNVSRFVGDVFVYLKERDDSNEPGAIVSTVLEAIKNAPKNHDEEPVIILTHSMGGNILYDILTHYAPDMRVDFWVSIGGQVGQFEEMNLFKTSDKNIRTPKKVTGLKPRVGYWLNVYDPADIFGFKAAPIFADVDKDVEYLTGAGDLESHGAYFKRASFYRMLRTHIEEALL